MLSRDCYQFYAACCAVITAIDVVDRLTASKDDIIITGTSSSIIGSPSSFLSNFSVANQLSSVVRALSVSSLNRPALRHFNVM